MVLLEKDGFLGCFAVLHYGDIKITANCINSLLKLNQIQDCLIVILDNDIRGNAKEDLLKKYHFFPNIQFIKMEEKCGFSKANNLFIKFSNRLI